MAPKKFYAVRKGVQPGIFYSWPDCQKQTNGFPGAEFKGFPTEKEAHEWYMGGAVTQPPPPVKRTRPDITQAAGASREQPAAGAAGASREQPGDVYQVEFDGASKGNPGRAGAGALVRHPDGSVVCELREGLGTASNNVAEYRSFLLGLKGALDRGIYRVRVQGDSDLLVKQILGKYQVRHPDLIPLCAEAHRLIQNFAEFSIRHVDREFNSAADNLANEAVFLPETKFVSYTATLC